VGVWVGVPGGVEVWVGVWVGVGVKVFVAVGVGVGQIQFEPLLMQLFPAKVTEAPGPHEGNPGKL